MTIHQPITTLVFDWGDTIMRDFGLPGPMKEWEKVEWIAGAEKSLKELSKKYTCVIATCADHSGTEEMIAALRRVGADRHFHHFFSSAELGFKKPDPRFFEAITAKINADPSKCVMIGNLYEMDIRGAKDAGLQTILFNESKIEGEFTAADEIIADMNNLILVIPF